MSGFFRGEIVTYEANGLLIEAIVRTLHRDGSVTVEARWVLPARRQGGGYLGYRYRMKTSDLVSTGYSGEINRTNP